MYTVRTTRCSGKLDSNKYVKQRGYYWWPFVVAQPNPFDTVPFQPIAHRRNSYPIGQVFRPLERKQLDLVIGRKSVEIADNL